MARLCPPITHLLFADDVMIFARAKASEAEVILKCLNTYSSWSGQHINVSKSAIFFSTNFNLSSKMLSIVFFIWIYSILRQNI
jgi:hypothetical protein